MKVRRYYKQHKDKAKAKLDLLFPSPAEVRFIELMGGKTFTFDRIKSRKNDVSLTLIFSRGKLLRRENMKRKALVGDDHIDFGNDIYRGIEVDAGSYFSDVVLQHERDEFFKKVGWNVLHIDAGDLWREPDNVQRRVMRFLTK